MQGFPRGFLPKFLICSIHLATTYALYSVKLGKQYVLKSESLYNVGKGLISQFTTQSLLKQGEVMFCLASFFAIGSLMVVKVSSHGRLIDPPARNSMWRFGFSNPPNFNDNELNCGGFSYQWSHGGECGACGDPYRKAQLHTFPGKYANNIVTRTYTTGSVIEVAVELTSNHKGFFEFRIGDVGTAPITEDKLDHLLEIAGTGATKYYLPAGSMNGIFSVSLQLPVDLVCVQCVLRWKYTAGNNWGTDQSGSGVGRGPQVC